MYYCKECQYTFSDPDLTQGDLCEYQGIMCRQTMQVCPVCGSTEFIEINEIKRKIEMLMEDYNIDEDTMVDIVNGYI